MTKLIALALAAAVILTDFHGNQATAATAPSPVHTLAWIGLTPSNALSQLTKLAKYHFNGFMYDNNYNMLHDDFLNGGTGRMTTADYTTYVNQTKSMVASAKSQGITDIFTRLNADVYVASNPWGQKYKFDIFNQTEVAAFQQSFKNEATFVKAVGFKGIWLDMEPYDYNYYWRQDQDSTMLAYGKTQSAVKAQYYKLGQYAEQAMLAAYPDIQVLMSPAFGYSGTGPTSPYEYYPDFYAGMVSVAAAQNAHGFVLATEAGYGITQLSSFAGIYNYEEGTNPIGYDANNNPIYSPVRTVLQQYDAANGTQLWAWHAAHSSVSLPSWPYTDATNNTSTSPATLRYPLTTFQQVVQTERSLSPQYTWVYSEGAGWLQSTYTCAWPSNSSLVATSLACPGLVLQSTLPALG